MPTNLLVRPSKLIQVLFPSIVWRRKTNHKNIWLTFDDGPCPQATPFILKTLKRQEIKATFFLVGAQIEKYPDLFKAIIKDGHVVGNHSYSHKNGWISKNSTYFDDIEKCQKFMPNNKLFRPPYGKISISQIKQLKKIYKIIIWDVLSWDFRLNIKPEKIKQNVMNYTKKGSIIVFHNNNKSFDNLNLVLTEIIEQLKEQKFSFSTSW